MKRAAILGCLTMLAATGWSAEALASGPLVCIAPSNPDDMKKPLADVASLEFYADEGDPMKSYSFPLKLAQSATDAGGRRENSYRVRDGSVAGATILFLGDTPLSFSVDELGRTFDSLNRNDEETAFMADAVPGVVCYSATVEADPL